MLQWNKDLSVGVRKIDEHHRQLAARASLLLERLPGSSAELIRDTFDFFETFITDHFLTEERHMESTGNSYSRKDSHKIAHRSFLNTFHAFRAELNKGATDHYFVFEFSRWITDWYQEHIKEHDKELGKFLRAAKRKRSAGH
jgi:hemerythrin-like metal-binding protein